MPEKDNHSRLASLSAEALLDRIARDRPLLPAAGSAVALAGATAAALGGFVARIALSHSGPDSQTLPPLVLRFDEIRGSLCDLITADADACIGFMQAGDARDRNRIIGPPRAMAEYGVELLELCLSLFPCIHPPTKADLSVAAELAKACVDGALRILSDNLPEGGSAVRDHLPDLARKAGDLYGRLKGLDPKSTLNFKGM